MRILHVVPTYLPAVRYGGPIRTVHALSRHLSDRGHEVHVFTTNVDGELDSPVALATPLSLDGVRVTYFASNFLRRLYWSPAMAKFLARTITSFDIVHTHSVFLWPTWAAARAARAAGVPYVLSPRGMLVPELVRRRSTLAKMMWINLIERRNLAKAAAIHVTSQIEKGDLERMQFNLQRVAVIPNGVEAPSATEWAKATADVRAAIGQGAFVLAICRLNWKKGLDRLVSSLASVPAMRLIIAGDDTEGEAARLHRLAAQTGVLDRLSIISRHVEGVDKEVLLARAQVFAMPSISENFGLAAAEAMRRGIPVVVTRGVGMSQIVQDAGAGLVVDDEPDALVAGLKALLSEPEAARAMGEAGRSHVIAQLDWARIAAKFEVLYRSILEAT